MRLRPSSCLSAGFSQVSSRWFPQAVGFAHRGARLAARENTLEAFRLALDEGVAGLESDVWLSADGEAVLDHDGLFGPPWRRRRVSELSLRELPDYVCPLRELYLQLGSDFELSLDLKDPAALDVVLELAARAGAAQRLWLCWEGWASGPLAPQAVLPAHPVESTDRRRMAGAEEALELLADRGVHALNLHASQWDAKLVQRAHLLGLAAFAWDVQSRADLERLLGLGIDAVYSDHPGLVCAPLALP